MTEGDFKVITIAVVLMTAAVLIINIGAMFYE